MSNPKNMKMAVLHINTAGPNATSPTMRIARYVAEKLQIPLIHDVESAATHSKTHFDILFVKLGVLKFSNHRDDALEIYGNAKRVINLENDYSFAPDARLKKLQPEWQVWSTVPENVKKHGGAYVNWNVLTWLYPHPWAARLRAYKPEPNRMLYYGAYRADRVNSFGRWLGQGVPYEVVIGARSTHMAKFAGLTDPPRNVVNFKTPDDLAQLKATAIYLEDDTSHDLYCSLANRFFECLQLGIPMLFDSACRNTLEAAKLPMWKRYSVINPFEAKARMSDPVTIAREQRLYWYKDFDALLAKQVERAVTTL